MRKSTLALGAFMFGAPFLLLAYAYNMLPEELPVMRSPLAGAVFVAPKSAFTVFRVPLMNLSHGLMAAVMVSRSADFKDHARRTGYSALFATLLFAVALKSDFEALEVSGIASALGGWITMATVGCIIGGVILALFRGRRAPIPWPELQLQSRDKIMLAALLGFYLLMVTASFLIAHRL